MRSSDIPWWARIYSIPILIGNQCCKLVEAAWSYLSGSYASAGEEEHLVVPQLEYLRIDLSSLLLVEPLKSIHQTQQLIIEVASETESYPERWLLRNCASLKFMNISKAELLPQSMKDLSSLQNLTLFDAGKLDSLPDLPLSLQNLYINICHPDLKKKIRAYGSPEWDKISHVPRLQIGDLCFILGKECSRSTYDELRFKNLDELSSWADKQKRRLWF